MDRACYHGGDSSANFDGKVSKKRKKQGKQTDIVQLLNRVSALFCTTQLLSSICTYSGL